MSWWGLRALIVSEVSMRAHAFTREKVPRCPESPDARLTMLLLHSRRPLPLEMRNVVAPLLLSLLLVVAITATVRVSKAGRRTRSNLTDSTEVPLSTLAGPLPPVAPSFHDYVARVRFTALPGSRSSDAIVGQLNRWTAAESMSLGGLHPLAPACITFGLSDGEFQRLAPVRRRVEDALSRVVSESARKYRRDMVVPRPVVRLEYDPGVTPGWLVKAATYEPPGAVDDGFEERESDPGLDRTSYEGAAVTVNAVAPTAHTPAPPVPDLEEAATVRSVLALHLPGGSRMPLPSEGTLMLGRGKDVEVPVLATGVSRHHAQMHISGVVAYIEDLDSLNGTYINGVQIPPRRVITLEVGDELQLGMDSRPMVLLNLA